MRLNGKAETCECHKSMFLCLRDLPLHLFQYGVTIDPRKTKYGEVSYLILMYVDARPIGPAWLRLRTIPPCKNLLEHPSIAVVQGSIVYCTVYN